MMNSYYLYGSAVMTSYKLLYVYKLHYNRIFFASKEDFIITSRDAPSGKKKVALTGQVVAQPVSPTFLPLPFANG